MFSKLYSSREGTTPRLGLSTRHIGPQRSTEPYKRETHEGKLTIKTSNPEYAYVSSAVGGSVSQVSVGDNAARSQVAATHGESTKGSVRGFSSKSRRTLLRRMASINRTAF